MGKIQVRIVRDPDSGLGSLYSDGKLVWDFYAQDPFDTYGKNGWDDALEELFARPEFDGFEYDVEGRHQLARQCNHPLDPVEYDGYWPDNIEDAPLDTRTYGPEDDLPADGDDIILIG